MDPYDPYYFRFRLPLAGHNTQYVTEPNPVRPRYWRRETVDGPVVDIPEPSTILLPVPEG
jgi:hypothetical protein